MSLSEPSYMKIKIWKLLPFQDIIYNFKQLSVLSKILNDLSKFFVKLMKLVFAIYQPEIDHYLFLLSFFIIFLVVSILFVRQITMLL